MVLALAGGWYFTREARLEERVALSSAPALVVSNPTSAASATVGLEQPADEREALRPGIDVPRHLLVGHALGLTADECREAHVEVDATWPYAIDAPPVRGKLDDSGHFEVPVDALLRFAEQWSNAGPPRDLFVLVDQPVHLRLRVRVPFAEGVSDAQGSVRHDAGELSLVAAAVLRGSMHLPDDAPAAGAVVEAFPADSGEPREFSAGQAECDAKGRFDLRLERGGEYALALLADGLRPGQRLDRAVLGEAHDLGVVTLESGAEISGRALRLGRPMPGAQIELHRVVGGRFLQRKDMPTIAWVDGRFEWGRVILHADGEGAFRQGGLAESQYELYVESPSTSQGCMRMRWDSTRVAAPSTNLALEFRAALVTLARSQGSPVEATGRIHVSTDGAEVAWFWFQPDQPATSFVAPPNTPLSLRIELEGLPPIALEIVTPGPGEELVRTLAFSDPVLSAALELQLVPDARLALDALHVTFESPTGEPRFDRGVEHDEIPESGLVRLEDLAPGLHRVRVHAGRDHLTRTPAFDRVLEIELRSGETAHARVAFELGGLLRIDVRDPSGARRRAQFRLLDAAGERMPMTFLAKSDNAGFSGDWYLAPFSANESETLATGDYELVLWDDGFEEQRLPVRILAGETTELIATLQPK